MSRISSLWRTGAATSSSIIGLVIQVTVNGKAHSLERPVNVRDLLEHLQMAGRKVAVERNGEIVPKGLHRETVVENGDAFEIVVAVGGG
jgi:sulfur carrier protein